MLHFNENETRMNKKVTKKCNVTQCEVKKSRKKGAFGVHINFGIRIAQLNL